VLEQRIQGLQRTNLLTLAGVAVSLLLAFLVIYFITRQITRPLNELSTVSDSLAKGDLSRLANIESRDEIGKLAKSFNNAVLQLRDANARQEAEIARGQQLQQNIGQFLEVAMDIAQGDLTKRGQVSEDALGNVVDAINYMTEELGYVLKGVQSATQSVNQGASDMFGTADSIARSAAVQAQEAQKAREDVQDIRSTMRQVSEEMMLSAESATQALKASREGQQAVVQTLNGMQDIRREVQAVSKRVKNLGDRSLEISEIVETISKISEQTNLLAVNAAIESSGAGEAGLRFAVVADQVRKLAEESAYAAERVSILIKNVQDEVQEVITGVEAGTREVEEGYRVASQAGQRLEDISKIVERSAELAQRIARATQDQVSRVVESMAEISQVSQSTVSQGRVAAEKLQQLATQLSDNLSRFRLA
jgi:twitching motility protein PilJ